MALSGPALVQAGHWRSGNPRRWSKAVRGSFHARWRPNCRLPRRIQFSHGQRRARDEAVDDARERAQHLGSLLGVTVGSVKQVVEINDANAAGDSAAERLGSGEGIGGGAAPAVSVGEIRVNSGVRVVFHIIE